MIDIKFKTDKAIQRFEKMPQNVRRSVSKESPKIITEVYSQALDDAPVWNDVLRHTVLYESEHFEQITESKLRMTLRYDAFNPKTNFHYALLRHEETTSGKPYWARIGMEQASPYVERFLIGAVKRGVGQ